jgi:hypothetical protein
MPRIRQLSRLAANLAEMAGDEGLMCQESYENQLGVFVCRIHIAAGF